MKSTINTLLDPVVNFGKVTVSTGYTNLDPVILLATTHGSKLPDPLIDGPFNLIWYNASRYADPSDDPNVEIVRCTIRTGDTLTVDRHQEGTSASNKNSSGDTYKMILSPTKKTITDIKTGYQSEVAAHATTTMSVHNFDSSGNAPAQIHNNTRHSETYLTPADNITARSLKSATTTIDISSSPAPNSGQVLTAVDNTTATWQYITVGIIPTGGIIPYAGSTPPSGFLLCDGSQVSRTTYAPLFSIISTTYGVGNGSTTFNVPDFRSRVIVGTGPVQGGLSARNRGEIGGEETHILTVGELAIHTHPVPIKGAGSYSYGRFDTGSGDVYATLPAGGDLPHNNMQPFGVANYIIKT